MRKYLLILFVICFMSFPSNISTASTVPLTKTVLANVAKFRPATASSWHTSYPPSNANDGMIDYSGWIPGSNGEMPSVAAKHWWQVDLTREYKLETIEIYARMNDSNPDNRSHLEVLLSTSPSFEDGTYDVIAQINSVDDTIFPTNGYWDIAVENDKPYRYLRVRKTVDKQFAPFFAEIKVFAYQTVTEVSRNKPAEACSQNSSLYTPDKANDGINTSNSVTGWCSGDTASTSHFHWWKVDLQDEYYIDYIEVDDRVNNDDITIRQMFKISGMDIDSTDFTNAEQLTKFGNPFDFPQYYPFNKGDTWQSTTPGDKSYRYIVWQKTYAQVGYIAEIRACVINPEIYDFKAQNHSVQFRFSDIMDANTLNPENVKIIDIDANTEITYTDYYTNGLYFTINSDEITEGKVYKAIVNENVKNLKNVSIASEYEKYFSLSDDSDDGTDPRFTKTVLTNVAQFRPATASSWSDTYPPQKANDGEIDDNGWFPGDKGELPSQSANHWWQVDLTRDYKLNSIEVYDRMNYTETDHRSYLQIIASTTPDFTEGTYDVISEIGAVDDLVFPNDEYWKITVDNDKPYRYVRVRKTKPTRWAPFIPEVKVFAYQTVTEVSRNKPAVACSQYDDLYPPHNAIDGELSKGWAAGDSAASPHYHWWKVDLGKAYYIDYFEIEDRPNNDDIGIRQMFKIMGMNNDSTDFSGAATLTKFGNPIRYPEFYPFNKGDTWKSTTSITEPYRYIVWQKTYFNQSGYLAELRACVINPEVYGFKAENNSVIIQFSDIMNQASLNLNNIKIIDEESGDEVFYTNYSTTSKTYNINSIDLEIGKKYKAIISRNVKNLKGVSITPNYEHDFVYGAELAAYDYKLIDSDNGVGNEIKYIEEGKKAGSKVTVTNDKKDGSDSSVILVTSLYKNDKLVSVSMDKQTVQYGNNITLKAGISIPNEHLHQYRFKSFLWDAMTMQPITNTKELASYMPFNTALKDIDPVIYDASGTGFDVQGLQSIYYQGLPYLGNETRVFAYLGIPDVPEGTKIPGIVLVHGGQGTAYQSWVKKWNERGYAAIAMDLGGKTPDMQRHSYAGPNQCTYSDFGEAEEDRWMYHAVADVMLANNILRKLPQVDSSKIGVTGVSWGGVVTSTTIGVDDRFAFAIPIYGCGYLYEAESYFRNEMTVSKKSWDPSVYFARSKMPMLWVNSDHDAHFPITCSSKSFRTVKENSTLTILPHLAHSQEHAMQPMESYVFADSIVKSGHKLIKITGEGIGENGKAYVLFETKDGVQANSAVMYYNTDGTLPYDNKGFLGEWIEVPYSSSENGKYEFEIPSGCKRLYMNIIDNFGYTVSSDLITIN